MNHNYFVYITTNSKRTVLYVGVTNDLETRLLQHFENSKQRKSFAGKYFCYHLIYFERHDFIEHGLKEKKKLKNGAGKRKML